MEMRPVTDAEFEAWLRAESRAHGNRLNHNPETLRPHFDLSRSLAVLDGGEIVGGAHSHRRELSLPGGGMAVVAGVSNVAVQPTHRRRGLMSRMMRGQLEDVYSRGETLAALFATESVIYGRFGYGIGTLYESWSIERPHTAYAHNWKTPGQIRFVAAADIGEVLPDIFRRSTAGRAGVFQKPAYKWAEEAAAPEHWQGGRGGRFYAVYGEQGRDEGYVSYRTGEGELTVIELLAATDAANAALWRFCFDMDLISRIRAQRRPVDDPLPWMLADPRRLQRVPRDGLWLRLVDAAAALQLRRYGIEGGLTLELRDESCPWNEGRLRLEAGPAGATCRRATADADLTLAADALGAAYLGGVTFTTLAGAGRVAENRPGALLRADRMFAGEGQPWTPCGFS